VSTHDEQEEQEEQEEQQIAEGRARDERTARHLGEYTPTSRPLYRDDARANLCHDIINFLERISDSAPDDLASSARDLLERAHAL
jgi:hypothetical protein